MTGTDRGVWFQRTPGMVAVVCVAFLLGPGCTPSSTVPAPGRGGTPSAREAYLLSLLSRNYTNPDLHLQMGQFYEESRNWDKAKYYFNLALDLDPAHTKTQVALIRMLLNKGDRQEAQQTVARFQKQMASSAAALDRLGQAFVKEGMDQYGLSFFNKAAEVAPKSPDPYKQLGFYYQSKNDTEKAKYYLTKSFELDPIQPEVAYALGRLGVPIRIPVDYGPQKTASPKGSTDGSH